MANWPGELTSKQEIILRQFRENVQDILQPKHDDIFLIRWLIARDYDLKKSEEMIRKSFTWRKQIGADTILETWEVPEVVRKYYTGGVCGNDKDGDPVWIDPFGHIDLKGIVHSAKKHDIIKAKVVVLEQVYKLLAQRSKELGRRVNQMSLIFDLDKAGLHHLYKPGMDVFCEILTMFEDNYPETLKMNYVINAPKFFPVAFKIIKPFLSERTIGKVKIYGSDYKQNLLKVIDADQLPVNLGGTMVDTNNNPRCETMVCYGGQVPKSYYLQANAKMQSDNMTQVSVGRGSSLQVDVNVEVAGSAIRWNFFTEDCDIGFGVFHKLLGAPRMKFNEMDIVMDTMRVNSHLVPEDGLVTCSHPGTYVLRFDNTYSWIKQKKVFYSFEIIPPEKIPHSQSEASFQSIPDEVYFSETPGGEVNDAETCSPEGVGDVDFNS